MCWGQPGVQAAVCGAAGRGVPEPRPRQSCREGRRGLGRHTLSGFRGSQVWVSTAPLRGRESVCVALHTVF